MKAATTKFPKRADFPRDLQIDRGSIVGPMGTFYGSLADCTVQFAHELIFRANAYAKLVEALEALADSHAELERERGSQRATHTANARALLRLLGE